MPLKAVKWRCAAFRAREDGGFRREKRKIPAGFLNPAGTDINKRTYRSAGGVNPPPEAEE